MYRKTRLLAALLIGVTPLLLGQQRDQGRPSGDPVPSQQLVAWSLLQKPKPVPQPLPPPDPDTPQPGQQAQPETPPGSSQTPVQTFTGKIIKDVGRYVLKTANGNAYQLDAQSTAKQFENQDVRVVGKLDPDSNTIRVDKIELLS